MINRLIEPTSGTVLIEGRDTREVDGVALRRQIGYVFQMIGLFGHMTIAQNVAIVPELLSWDRGRIRGRVDELLELVGLPPDQYRDRYPRQLSGGQRQRVGFARALAAGPRIMLLDEPLGALDPITRDALQVEFKRIQAKLHLTAVMVTHDMTEALLLADRIAVMDHGRIVCVDTPRQLMSEPQDGMVGSLMASPRRQIAQLEAIAEGRSTETAV
jgi:osmoprotectant transport system ATP-binding protein